MGLLKGQVMLYVAMSIHTYSLRYAGCENRHKSGDKT